MKANSFIKVKSLEEAYKLVKESPKNKIVGGGLWLKKGNAACDKLIDLSLLGLDKIEDKGEFISVGAMVSQRELEKSPLIKDIGHGVISKAVSEIMGPAFRELATVGGSVYGKYGFSDLITALLVVKTKLVFYPDAELSLEEYLAKPGFYDGILTHILIKKCHCKTFFKKVKITALDYPIVNIGVHKCEKHTFVVVGSRPGVASISKEAQKYLEEGGKDFEKAAELAVNELKFGDSISTKADYRKHLAKVYIARGLEEVSK